jgi:hypothetical protein
VKTKQFSFALIPWVLYGARTRGTRNAQRRPNHPAALVSSAYEKAFVCASIFGWLETPSFPSANQEPAPPHLDALWWGRGQLEDFLLLGGAGGGGRKTCGMPRIRGSMSLCVCDSAETAMFKGSLHIPCRSAKSLQLQLYCREARDAQLHRASSSSSRSRLLLLPFVSCTKPDRMWQEGYPACALRLADEEVRYAHTRTGIKRRNM